MSVQRLMVRRFVGGRPVGVLLIVATALGTWTFTRGPARAAELRLRPECRCDGPLVTLGDVAEIFAADPRQAEMLAAVELFPAPSPARQRFVRLREIQDLLLLRGVNLTEHRFSGSSQVAILGSEPVRTQRERSLSSSAEKAANRRVAEAVVQYLQQTETTAADTPWSVEVELDRDRARLAAGADRKISITGGAPPWTGRQRFDVTVDTPDGPVRFPLNAQVTAPSEVVIAVRSLPRGAILCAADVALKHQPPQDKGAKGFYSIEEVIGKETTRAITRGKMLEAEMVRALLLVRRRDVVTVYARNAGIRVRTVGRAREDGSLGALIPIESLQDRKAYFARVSGVREVEVYARSVQAGRTGSRSSYVLGRQPGS